MTTFFTQNKFKYFALLLMILLGINTSLAQVQVNGNSQNAVLNSQHPFLSADLFTDAFFGTNVGKAINFPSTDLTQWEFIIDPAVLNFTVNPNFYDGLIVYNVGTGNTTATASVGGVQVAVSPGFYYFKNPGITFLTPAADRIRNGRWVPLSDGASVFPWEITGNSGTATTTFLGTTDANPLRIRTNNIERIRITDNGNIGIGNPNPTQTLSVSGTAQITGALYDSSGDAGNNGQVLSSTGSSTNWVNSIAEGPAELKIVGGLKDAADFNGAFSVFARENYAYVVNLNDSSLRIIDVSNPAAPVLLGGVKDVTDLNSPRSVFVQGDYAYVTSSGNNSLRIIDVSNPNNPSIVGGIKDDTILSGAFSVHVQGNYAYVANFVDNSFRVVDVSNASSPTIVGGIKDDTNLFGIRQVFVQGNYAYLTSVDGDSFRIVDVSNPYAPTLLGGLQDATNFDGAHSVFVQGNYAYVANSFDNSVRIIDVSDPNAPVVVGGIKDDTNLDGAFSVFVQGNYAYVASLSDNSLRVIDVSNPVSPTLEGGIKDDTNLSSILSVFVQGNYAYAGNFLDDSFRVIELGTNTTYALDVGALKASSLYVDNYAHFNNTLDIRGGLNVDNSTKINGNLSVKREFIDSSGDAGNNGQVLSSTSSGTLWIDSSAGGVVDDDGDTKIQVEEGSDDDTIRLDAANVEVASFTSTQTNLNTTLNVNAAARLVGGVYANFRTLSTSSITWTDQDYGIKTTIPMVDFYLPDATLNTGRIVAIHNGSYDYLGFGPPGASNAMIARTPVDFPIIRPSSGATFMSDGQRWYAFNRPHTINTIVVGAGGRTWLDRNLGATRVAQTVTDTMAYGDYYQWGRAADGHQLSNSSTTTLNAQATTAVPNAGNPWDGLFIVTNIPSPKFIDITWLTTFTFATHGNLWTGIDAVNNPCPPGFRIPTSAELQAEASAWSTQDAQGAFDSNLKLPLAGVRNGRTGDLEAQGIDAALWSTEYTSGTRFLILDVDSTQANVFTNRTIAHGTAVRCILHE